MSDQLTPDEIAYIANWLSKPEVRTGLVSLVKLLFASRPPVYPVRVPPVHAGAMATPFAATKMAHTLICRNCGNSGVDMFGKTCPCQKRCCDGR